MSIHPTKQATSCCRPHRLGLKAQQAVRAHAPRRLHAAAAQLPQQAVGLTRCLGHLCVTHMEQQVCKQRGAGVSTVVYTADLGAHSWCTIHAQQRLGGWNGCSMHADGYWAVI
jgi:hypothetical protein